MKFPYGSCDFYDIVTDDYFYMDRTDKIPLIENAGKHLLFLRPRRFGKSLLLSVLENYYDAAKADEFEKLFGHLSVGRSPTGRHSQYFVLKWDFSAVNPQGEPGDIERNLHRYINGRIEKFAVYYQDRLPRDIRIESEDAMASFQSLLTAIQHTPHKLYLLIDEYDNFANETMMTSGEMSAGRYKSLIHGEGCLKAVFKVVKAATAGEGLDRAFITGVSPVVMSDVTSGHNIAENISLLPEFGDLCGFTDSEVIDTLERIVRECGFPPETAGEASEMMRKFYDGYRFGQRSEGNLYNPTLALYFMKAFQSYREYPGEMLDENLAMDREKLAYISRLPGGERLITDALNESDPLSIQRLARRFGVEDMLSAPRDTAFMASLLFYLGVLTLTGQRTGMGKLVLRIPNLVTRGLYVERIQEMLLPKFAEKDDARRTAEQFYETGDMQPLCDFMESRYFSAFDNRDLRWANELTVKTAFLTLLFNDTFYITDSETELERTYSDLAMIVRPDMRQYSLLDILMEFKYVPLGKNKLTGKKVRGMSMAELAALEPVKAEMADAREQLAEYRGKLEKNYGDTLRLHTYAVVAVGFDRIVWEELKVE